MKPYYDPDMQKDCLEDSPKIIQDTNPPRAEPESTSPEEKRMTCCSVGSFTKEPIKKDKDSGPDGTAHHGAQQGKAVAGSRRPQPQYLLCMLAKTKTLKATSWNVCHL
ncbi:hypothetical protein AVEN_100056-1 [Araneus ventricosus]|uniref:Uncharacterized protein n=1 Tax=Araneus ventricosus TaxID=182803 RepID=A0A4Y2QPV0_ARAVE|nr:hypothetical protein AVEN_100056-1 [Araneus ventricosus]